MIGCDCPVCMSGDPRNRRKRTSLYVQAGDTCVVVDTPPDFREQALMYALVQIDAVLFTHAHADHVFGFDDIRRFNTLQKRVIPAYGSAATIKDLRRIFNYVEENKEVGVYRPHVEFVEVAGAFDVGSLDVTPVAVLHDPKPTYGYVFEHDGKRVAYVPDCHEMADEVVECLQGVDVMILDALRHRPHRTHLTVEQSVAYLKRIGAGRSYLIHMCHDVDHEETQSSLPEGIAVSYDGLVVDV